MNEREKAFENKYIHDEEIKFKIYARTSKHLGLWAAKKMNIVENEATEYAKNLVDWSIDQHYDQDKLVEKLIADFNSKNIVVEETEISEEYNKLYEVSRQHIANN
ncbi:MAG: DUF1476 domain-containing protein [Alphaproteobacteria bacterium]